MPKYEEPHKTAPVSKTATPKELVKEPAKPATREDVVPDDAPATDASSMTYDDAMVCVGRGQKVCQLTWPMGVTMDSTGVLLHGEPMIDQEATNWMVSG